MSSNETANLPTEDTMESVPSDDTPVDLQAEYENSNVQEVLDKLDRELIGLKPVKTRIKETAALLLVDRVRKSLNLTSGAPSLHMSFTGNLGTGKTTVASRMAELSVRRKRQLTKEELLSLVTDSRGAPT